MRKAAPKVTITEEMKEIQNKLIVFLKQNPTIKAKKLYPFGHEVDISTIPDNKSQEFLSIVNPNIE